MNWIPTTERLPEDRERILFAPTTKPYGANLMMGVFVARYDDGFISADNVFLGVDRSFYYPQSITHWMPLPAFPNLT